MNENPKRPFLQLRLLTAIILLFEASILVPPAILLLVEGLNPRNNGFPDWIPLDAAILILCIYCPIVVAVLVGTACVSEYLIRRRERQRAAIPAESEVLRE